MSYCTIEEAWGNDFKKTKKTKKKKKLESVNKSRIDVIDKEILIPDSNRRNINTTPNNNSSISAFDKYSGYSPYNLYPIKQVETSNESIISNQTKEPSHSSLIKDVEKPIDDIIKLSKKEYNKIVEGFANQTDDQFNQLLLFIFTGLFYLFTLDMMYQLGKKSY